MSDDKIIDKRRRLFIEALQLRAKVYSLIGEYDRGIEDVRKAIFTCRIENPPDLSLIANLTIQLADMIQEGKNNYDAAQILIKRLLREKKLRRDLPAYSAALNTLGINFRHCGNYNAALKYHKMALRVNKRLKDNTQIGRTF
ncbi:MAG: tetratricopeptide repeat protein, partial [candidate division WOR-3 bacterium]